MQGYYATPILPLARDKVRYVGEPVVGDRGREPLSRRGCRRADRDRFRAAARRRRSAEAARAGAPLLHEEAGTNVMVAREFKRGDVDVAFAQAPVRVGGRFRMRRKTPMAIEPRACLAEYEPGRDASPCIPPRRSPASSATRWPRRSICRPTPARGRARRRRRVRRQGLALSGGDLRLRGRARARPPGEVDQRPHGGSSSRPARRSTRSSMPSWRSTPTARCWRCAPT